MYSDLGEDSMRHLYLHLDLNLDTCNLKIVTLAVDPAKFVSIKAQKITHRVYTYIDLVQLFKKIKIFMK